MVLSTGGMAPSGHGWYGLPFGETVWIPLSSEGYACVGSSDGHDAYIESKTLRSVCFGKFEIDGLMFPENNSTVDKFVFLPSGRKPDVILPKPGGDPPRTGFGGGCRGSL